MRIFVFCLLFFLAGCDSEPTLKGHEYVWVTESGLPITLGFDSHENRYFGKAVNQYYGLYTATETQISFQSPSSTMRMGNSKNMQDEEDFLDSLVQIQTFKLSGNKLSLFGKNGKQIILTQKENTYKKDVKNDH